MKITEARATQIVAAAIELEDAARAVAAGFSSAEVLHVAREQFNKITSDAYDEAIAA